MDKTQVSSVTQIKSKIKVVFLGEQSTGKTSILMRFMHDRFEQGLGATVGIDFMAKNLNVGLYSLRLQLWDTAGQQRFRSLIPSYLKDAMITFIVFDVCNGKSFENLRQWFDLCSQNRREKSVIVLLGNKCDLNEREVTLAQATETAKQNNMKYFEVSAKSGQNIRNAFNYAGGEYISTNLQTNDMCFTKTLDTKDLRSVKNEVEQKQAKNNIIINKAENSSVKDKKKGCC